MDNYITILTAVALVVLGLSFFWKAIKALLWGDVSYWTGFLPLTLISPLFIHLPPKKDSLIKTKRAGWVHFALGPLFLFISLALLSAGADQLGLPGSQSLNYMLTMGRSGVEPAISYSPNGGYKLNFINQVKDALYKAATGKVLENKHPL